MGKWDSIAGRDRNDFLFSTSSHPTRTGKISSEVKQPGNLAERNLVQSLRMPGAIPTTPPPIHLHGAVNT